MLGKLIKYELMAEYRKYAAMYAVMLVFAVSFLIVDRGIGLFGSFPIAELIGKLLIALLICTSIVALVMVFMFTMKRIYTNIFKDEGYLMHTLPVPEWQHIIAKVAGCYVWFAATAAAILVCLTMLVGTEWIDGIGQLRESILSGTESGGLTLGFVRTYVRFILVGLIISPFNFTIYVYFCLAVGNLFNKNKLLMSVVAYIAVNVVSQIIMSVYMAVVGFVNFDSLIEGNFDAVLFEKMYGGLCIFSIIVAVLLYAAMYFVTVRVMKNKLNLE